MLCVSTATLEPRKALPHGEGLLRKVPTCGTMKVCHNYQVDGTNLEEHFRSSVSVKRPMCATYRIFPKGLNGSGVVEEPCGGTQALRKESKKGGPFIGVGNCPRQTGQGRSGLLVAYRDAGRKVGIIGKRCRLERGNRFLGFQQRWTE